MKKFASWALGLIGVVVVVALIGDGENVSETVTCGELSKHIMELSKEQKNPLKATMLKMYDIQEVSPPAEGRVLDCTADIKWDRGDNSRISFYIEQDSEGSQFYGYKPL